MKEYPSQEFLKNLFRYENGMLFYIRNPQIKNLIGTRAGWNGRLGYRLVTINNEIFFEHRIIYILLNGSIPDEMLIDHIDRNKSNNNIENLRVVNKSGNNLNRSTTTSIQKWTDTKWYARFRFRGERYSNFFSSREEAEKWLEDSKSEIINSHC